MDNGSNEKHRLLIHLSIHIGEVMTYILHTYIHTYMSLTMSYHAHFSCFLLSIFTINISLTLQSYNPEWRDTYKCTTMHYTSELTFHTRVPAPPFLLHQPTSVHVEGSEGGRRASRGGKTLTGTHSWRPPQAGPDGKLVLFSTCRNTPSLAKHLTIIIIIIQWPNESRSV